GNRGNLAHLGAKGLDETVFLRRLVVGHHDDAAVAARIADMGDADAGIAGGAFHHRATGPECAARLGIEHDPARGAVLHRAARIHEFGLGEDLAAGFLAQPVEAQQRCVAHCINETLSQTHPAFPFSSLACAASACGPIRPFTCASAATSPTTSKVGDFNRAAATVAGRSATVVVSTRSSGHVARSSSATGVAGDRPLASSWPAM